MTEHKSNQEQLSIVKEITNVPAKVTVNQIKSLIESGEVDPAYVGVVLKKFAKVAEDVKKDKSLYEIIESETLKHQNGTTKTFSLYGAKVTVASRGFYDYSKTDDPLLKKLREIESLIAERIKLRKTEIEMKTSIWNNENNTLNISKFGIKPFTLTWDALPKLTWVEAYGEVETNPPAHRSTDQLRYSV